MTTTHTPARTSAIATLVALAVVLGAAPSAFGQGEIPLQDVISPQYQAPSADIAAQVVEAVAPAAAQVVPHAPAAPPEPVAPTPQYHPSENSGNSEGVTQKASPPAPAPEPPADPPPPEDAHAAPEPEHAPPPATPEPAAAAPEPVPASAPPDPTAVLPDPTAALPDATATLPDLGVALPDLGVALPDLHAASPEPDPGAQATAPDPVAPVPVVPAPPSSAGNINVSIRIFSPGDNGPVTQTGGGDATPPATGVVPAPTTWIWNWTWTGSPDCLTAPPGNVAPSGAGDWTWTWTWFCDGTLAPTAAGELPMVPGMEDVLPASEIVAGVLPGLVPDPALEALAPIAPAFAAPPSRHDPPAAADLRLAAAAAPYRPAAAPSLLAPAAAPGLVAESGPAVPGSARERAARRDRDRDTTRSDGLVPPPVSPADAAFAAASSVASTAGSGPAALTLTLTLLAAFLAGTLLQIVGLPRLLLRAARLERPG